MYANMYLQILMNYTALKYLILILMVVTLWASLMVILDQRCRTLLEDQDNELRKVKCTLLVFRRNFLHFYCPLVLVLWWTRNTRCDAALRGVCKRTVYANKVQISCLEILNVLTSLSVIPRKTRNLCQEAIN